MNNNTCTLFTSESVSEGHPDKLCDQLSDAVLDACLKDDPQSHVACECFTSRGMMLVGGEIHTSSDVDLHSLSRALLCKVGYQEMAEQMAIINVIQEQSPDISQGVFKSDDFGAGDQGIMFGYACKETPELMPLPIILAHRLVQQAAKLRHQKQLENLLPDAKSQVTIAYLNGIPQSVSTVVLSHQHKENLSLEELRHQLLELVIKPILLDYNMLNDQLEVFINPNGRFVLGGPAADCGLTGRKIIADSYGGMARHGGGAFSGKDSSKVDRSAAYMARYVAKNIVAANLAARCEVQLSYAISLKSPLSIALECFGTENCDLNKLRSSLPEIFDFSPKGMTETLQLRQPCFQATAAYGHFGRSEFSWERCDKVDELTKLF